MPCQAGNRDADCGQRGGNAKAMSTNPQSIEGFSVALIRPAMTVGAAELLGVSRTHVINLIKGRVKGVPKLPVVQLGSTYRIRRETFERWLKQCETGDAA